MYAQRSLVATMAVVLGIGIGAALNAPTVAQQQPQQAATARAIGRYRMQLSGRSPTVIDTTTGHCWTFAYDAKGTEKWFDMGTPVAPQTGRADEQP